MEDKKVIDSKNLPTKLPVGGTVLAWISLEHWHASQLAWGITGTLIAILWVCAIWVKCLEKKVDIFSKEDKK